MYDDEFTGLCPDHDRGYVQIAARHFRRIKHEFTFVAKDWLPVGDDMADLADGIYCSVCIRRRPAGRPTLEPFPGDLAHAELGKLTLERPLDAHDHRRSVHDLAGAIADITGARIDLLGVAPTHVGAPASLSPTMVKALMRAIPKGPYPHQAEAIDAGCVGHDVIQITSTSSGKTIGFVTPILDRLIRQPGTRAIITTPLRVLPAQIIDTVGRFGRLDEVAHGWFTLDIDGADRTITVAVLDGGHADAKVRARIPVEADLLITNHHMVHDHLLGGRRAVWNDFLRSVCMVAIDEIDRNRGGQAAEQRGVTVALIEAITHLSGARPQLLTASATVSNPVDVHTQFGGRSDVRVVDGAVDHGHDRTIVVVDATDADLHAVIADVVVAMHAARPDAPPAALVFGRSKDGNEQLVRTIRAELAARGQHSASGAVVPYHSEVTSEDRRDTERKIRSGAVRTVVATSALEAGADIDQISVCILAGMPDTASEIRQRIGRAGRKGPALIVLVADDSPIGRALLAADDPRDVLGVETPHVVATTSAPTNVRVIIDPLARHFEVVPAEIVARLCADAVAAAVASGRYTLVDGALVPDVPLEPVGNRERLASSSDEYTLVTSAGSPAGRLSGARAARIGFVGAELSIRGMAHRVVKVEFRKLYVKRIPDLTGVTASTWTEIGDVEPVGTVLVAGSKVALGLASPTLRVVPSIEATGRRVRHSWTDAATAHITPPDTLSAGELALAIGEHAWRIGVSPFDIEVQVTAGAVTIVDLARAGRMSWHVADNLDEIIGRIPPRRRPKAA